MHSLLHLHTQWFEGQGCQSTAFVHWWSSHLSDRAQEWERWLSWCTLWLSHSHLHKTMTGQVSLSCTLTQNNDKAGVILTPAQTQNNDKAGVILTPVHRHKTMTRQVLYSHLHRHKTMTRQVLYSHLHTDIKQWQGRCYTHTCTDIKQWQGRCYTHASTHTQNNDRAGVIPTPAERKLTGQVPLTAVHSNKTMTGQVLYSHLQKENLQDRCHSQLYTATKKGRNKCYTHTCRQTQNSDKAGIRLTPGEEKKRKEKKKIFF